MIPLLNSRAVCLGLRYGVEFHGGSLIVEDGSKTSPEKLLLIRDTAGPGSARGRLVPTAPLPTKRIKQGLVAYDSSLPRGTWTNRASLSIVVGDFKLEMNCIFPRT